MDLMKLMESMTLTDNQPDLTFFKSFGVIIDDKTTDIIYADHENRVFIACSQYKKFGSLLAVTKEQTVDSEGLNQPVFTVKPMFGSENPEQEACARYIAEKLNIDKTLNIFLCLNNYDIPLVKHLADILVNIHNSIGK